MTSIRQNKVARLIQKELGEIFQRESKSLFGGAFITVTTVRIAPDLGSARVYLSIFGSASNDEVIEHVKLQTGNIKRILGAKIRHQLRGVPDLSFFIDDSLDYALKIDELLK